MTDLAPVRVTAPAEPLLTLGEARAHLRVDTTDENDLITGLIASVESYLDGYSGALGRALVTQTWRQSFRTFCYPGFRLPLSNLISVASIKYYDTANVQQTVDPAIYYALEDHLGPVITLGYNYTWPNTYYRPDAVTIEWTCGYGTIDDVPQAIKQAALLLIGGWFDNRSSVIDNNKAIEMPLAVRALLQPFSRTGI